MRTSRERRAIVAAALLALPLLAGEAVAQFYGGAAEGIASSRRHDLEERALELDRRDGGNRSDQLRQRHDAEELNRLMRRNNELLDDLRRQRAIRGW